VVVERFPVEIEFKGIDDVSDEIKTFNSLSRDHQALFRDFPAFRGVLPRRPFAQMIPKTTI